LLLMLPLSSLGFRPPRLSDELGCSPTLSLFLGGRQSKPFYFDPLGIANDENFSRLRESELKASRICMMAVTYSMIVPFLQYVEKPWLTLTNENSYTFYQGILARIDSLSLADYAKVGITCGIVELLVFVQREDCLPGDYGTGYWFRRDKGKHERSLIVELENGRLAMIAFAIQLITEIITHKTWVEQWTSIYYSIEETRLLQAGVAVYDS
jgi:hypothetical protein